MRPLNRKNYAANTISRHLKALLKEKNGVLSSDDIEYLHRMRVASRRLSNSLWTFHELIPERNYKTLRLMFGKITKSLGKARDLDTYITFLVNTAKLPGFTRFSPKINSLILKAKKERLQLKKVVSQAMIDLGKGVDLPILENLPRKNLQAFARKKILRRLKKLLLFREYAKYPHKYKKLHCLRIAAKHLRYTLENFDELYDGRLKPYIGKIHLLQDYLGDMHNYNVWGKFNRNDLLQEYCRNLYCKSYDLFYREWKKQERFKTWNNLKMLIKG